MEDKEEYEEASSELHRTLEVVAESLGVSVTRDREWPKSARWLSRRIKVVLPLLVAVGIEASREEDKSGSKIILRKTPNDDATVATEAETGKDKPKTDGNKGRNNAAAIATTDITNATGGDIVNPNTTSNVTAKADSYADSGNGGNSGIRPGTLWDA